jgi:hypothetical protein
MSFLTRSYLSLFERNPNCLSQWHMLIRFAIDQRFGDIFSFCRRISLISSHRIFSLINCKGSCIFGHTAKTDSPVLFNYSHSRQSADLTSSSRVCPTIDFMPRTSLNRVSLFSDSYLPTPIPWLNHFYKAMPPPQTDCPAVDNLDPP